MPVGSLHFTLPRLVFYAHVYALNTPVDAQIKFEASFLQKQNLRRLTDFTKAHLPFRFLETSPLAMVNGHLHLRKAVTSRPVSSVGRASDF